MSRTSRIRHHLARTIAAVRRTIRTASRSPRTPSSTHAFRLLAEHLNDGALLISRDGTILFCNACIARMLHRPAATVTGTNLRSHIAPSHQTAVESLIKSRSTRTRHPAGDLAFCTADHTTIPCRVSVVPTAAGIIALTVTDISALKNTHKAIADEKLARSILDQSEEAIIVCDRAGLIVRVSNAARKLCGGSPVSRHFDDTFPFCACPGAAADAPRFTIAAPARGEIIHGREVCYTLQNGETAHLLLNAGPLKNAKHAIFGCVVTLTDITRLKVTEEQLRRMSALAESRAREAEESHRILNALMQYIPEGIAIVSKKAQTVLMISHKGFEMLKIPEQTLSGVSFMGMYDRWDFLPGNDAPPLPLAQFPLTTALRDGTVTIEQELLVRQRSNGKTMRLLVNAAPIYEDSGAITEAIITWRDITERYRMEEALRESEEKYRILAEESPNMIFIQQRGRLVYANRRAAELLGYTPDELRADDFTAARFLPVDYAAHYQSALDRHMRGEPVAPEEYPLLTKSGGRIDTIIATSLITFAGAPAILGIVTDITEKNAMVSENLRHIKNLSFLSRTAMQLVRLPPQEDLFSFIGEHLLKLSGNALVITADFDPVHTAVRLRGIHGSSAVQAKLRSIIAAPLIGTTFPVNKAVRDALAKGRLVKIPGGLQELMGAQLSPELRHSIEVLLHIQHTYLIPLMVQNEMLGVIGLIPRGDESPAHVNLIEAFVNQAAVALKRKQAVESLQQREQEFRALVENSPDIILRINRQGEVAYANPAARDIAGIPARLLTNQRTGPTHMSALRPDWHALFSQVFTTGQEAVTEFSFESYRGLRHYHARMVPEVSPEGIPQTLLTIAHDITERKRAEEQLQRAADEWQTTFDAISDSIAIVDIQHALVRANAAFLSAFRQSAEHIVGRKCHAVVCHSLRPCAGCLQAEVLLTGKTAIREVFNKSLNTHLEITISPIFNKRGAVVNTVHVLKNINERKRVEEFMRRDKDTLERLVQHKTSELMEAQREVERSKRLSDIGVLAATIAHELRNPLAAINAAAYNIRRKAQNPILENHIANIEKKTREGDQIIKNLLSYSRIKLPNYETVDLEEIIQECIASAREKYSKWQVTIERPGTHPGQLLIDADPVHLRVLFSNIIDNAYQALEHKTGTVTILTAADAPGEARISISDTGAGIAREDLARIAEPFFTRKSRGIGLGLAVCSQIVTLHNGTIHFTSEAGTGTTVTVTLPLKRIPPSENT